jgi:hypothetical protein
VENKINAVDEIKEYEFRSTGGYVTAAIILAKAIIYLADQLAKAVNNVSDSIDNKSFH